MWHVTRDMWHMTRDRWGDVNILSNFELASSSGQEWSCSEDLGEKDETPGEFL